MVGDDAWETALDRQSFHRCCRYKKRRLDYCMTTVMNRLTISVPGSRIQGGQGPRPKTTAFRTRPDRRCIQVDAFFKTGGKQANEEEEMFTGFRYDPSMQVCGEETMHCSGHCSGLICF